MNDKIVNEKGEVWREYIIDVKHDSFFKLEVSNHGRLKAYNSHYPEGYIVKGSQQGGFPIYRFNLFKKRSEVDEAKIQALQMKIDAFQLLIKECPNSENEKKAKLREDRDALVLKRKKLNERIYKKRRINVAVLFHKAVAETFLETPKEKNKKFIIHKDFDKLNNHANNLEWATQDEVTARLAQHPKNILNEFKKQFEKRKPNTKMGKLKDRDVLYIKMRLKKGDTLKKLAQKFQVSDMQIHRIKTGENWGHVKLVEDLVAGDANA